ncbi:MAG: alpha/beta hydrolase [Myxococcota bacterium]
MGNARFVLVHGAWHGGWCWRHVQRELQAKGYEVDAPTLPGLAERASEMSRDLTLEAMVDDVVSYLADRALTDVVLVGHSFGGTVITGVADRARERLRRLVYLDAVVIESGERGFDTVPADAVAARRRSAEAFDGGISMPPPAPEVFGLGPEHRWASEQLTPHPMASYESPLRLAHPVGNGLPVSYVACTKPWYATSKLWRDRAVAHGWAITTLPTAHDAMVLAPEATAALLDEDVR